MKTQRGFTLFELLTVIWVLAVLAFAGALIYVGFHFLSKVW